MRIIDFYPSQGSYSPGETVTFFIELDIDCAQSSALRICIKHLSDPPIMIEQTLLLHPGEQRLQMDWTPPAQPAGYAAGLDVIFPNGSLALSAVTAFDVLSCWTDFPRYGFLSDFSASRAEPETVLRKLARFHINGLQFYDWQYRHDQLLAPEEEYIDPLGREMSLASVRKLVEVAHQYGMTAMPYLAIYAASANFWHAHRDWALYDENGNPIPFGENFLGLMDPSIGSPWSEHLLSEAGRVLKAIPFDGLHIDQYGDPKRAWDSQDNPVDLPRAFEQFVHAASNRHPDKTILFNAVGNWPIEALASSAVDFMYIEVWPPDVEYRQLAEIVLNAIRLSDGKAVVIALYLPANRLANNLLADAVILACGGTRIELGEDTRLLSDPYFPKHEEISQELSLALRQFADFAVRNGEWLRPYTLTSDEKGQWTHGALNPTFVSLDDAIMTVTRQRTKSIIVHLVNFNGLSVQQRWDKEHPAPAPCQNLSVSLPMPQEPQRVLWDCPDLSNGPQALTFGYSNGVLTFQIPQIKYVGLVVIHE